MKITLRAARVNAGYSQTEAAELIGVHLQSVWNWENGKAIYQVHLEKVAELYGIPIEKLIYKKATREKKRNVEKN